MLSELQSYQVCRLFAWKLLIVTRLGLRHVVIQIL